jgi:phosphate starvation-inducible protein PhoH and related proteins
LNTTDISRLLTFADNRLAQQLYGEYDQHLSLVQEATGAQVRSRGNTVDLAGPEGAVLRAEEALQSLYQLLKQGQTIDTGTVRAALRFTVSSDARVELSAQDVTIATRKRKVQPRTPAQADYIRKVRTHKLTFALGPAGTGKTYLAVAAAVAAMAAGEVERLVLSRPAVEAGERIGFLPGDMKEKVDPYLRPLYDALGDMLPADLVQRQIDSGSIEIAPLAFMRGRTLAHAFVILDEAQNTSPQQMMMFLTRFGDGARMVVCGDPDQVDLPPATPSGLADAVLRLEGVPEIAVQRFSAADVVRDPLVGRIVLAYAKPTMPPPAITRQHSTVQSQPISTAAVTSVKRSLEIEVAVDSTDWTERLPNIEQRVEQVAQATWKAIGHTVGEDAAVAILLADDPTLANLNSRFRGIDKPTNVLSFEPEGELPAMGDEARHIGDIAIAYETVSREAIAQDKTLDQHLSHMIVHGLLHLVGYDHQVTDDRNRMETIERAILAELGVPDPYDEDTV